MERISGQTKALMKDNGAKTNAMVKAQGFIQTKADMLALGLTVKNTARAHSLQQRALLKLESGSKIDL